MSSRIVQQIEDDLDVDQMRDVGVTEAAIARTPEGTAFVDVLSTKTNNQLLDKNIKDYDTLKWEEDLKSQLAQKKGQTKKLTSEEQAKVNAQLAKEKIIRQKVQRVELKVRRGAGIIQSLATGPPTEAERWINPVVMALLGVARTGVGLFVGDAVAMAFLACSQRVSSRLGTLRRSIGIATLRALGNSYLPQELEEEPLGGK